MADWQRIETAPKDGTVVLVCGDGDNGYWVGDAKCIGGDWCLFHPEDDDYTMPTFSATHWMPLPEPPLMEQQQYG